MKQRHPIQSFFTVLFGGLILLFSCVGMFSVGAFIWRSVNHDTVRAVGTSGGDATGVNDAIAASIEPAHYSAAEEEDLIDAATQSLPKGYVGAVTAKAYVAKDLTTGQTVLQNDANRLLPIASLSKLVTAVVARRLIPESSRIAITDAVMKTYGNTASFRAGETFTSSDLLYPLLMVSSNDAAEAYAAHYGRSKFIQAMNDFAQSIGAYRTSFSDPSGLDPRNVSTANDMALILDWIKKNDPTILDITELKAKTIRSHTWINPTHFLSWSYYIGGKNGYLPEANRTNASLFKWGSNGDVYALVVLGSSERDADTLALLNKIKK
jgi:D-alanyl-D-alanine carboxypeptidase